MHQFPQPSELQWSHLSLSTQRNACIRYYSNEKSFSFCKFFLVSPNFGGWIEIKKKKLHDKGNESAQVISYFEPFENIISTLFRLYLCESHLDLFVLFIINRLKVFKIILSCTFPTSHSNEDRVSCAIKLEDSCL